MGTITQKTIITPSTPAAGYYRFYPKADGFYMLDENGIETKIGSSTTTMTFGTEFKKSENEVQTSYSTLTPTTYLTLVTPNLPLGNYRLGYNFQWKYDDVAGNSAHFDIIDNGVSHLPAEIKMETKNIFDVVVIGSFLYLDNISGVRTIEIKTHCDDISDTVTVYSAYLELWRVS